MAQINGNGSALGQESVQFFRTCEGHPLHQLFPAHGHELERLYDVIAEPVVEALLYVAQFRIGLLGKAVPEVLSYHLVAVFHDMRHNQIEDIREQVQHRERQECQQIPEAVGKEIKGLVKGFLH